MDTIIYIGGFRLPDGNAAAPRVLNNAKIFRDLGYNVVFIDVADNVDKNVLNNKSQVDGFMCYSKKYPSRMEWYHYLTSISDFKKVYEKCENVKYVIAYNYQSVAFLKLKKFCKKKNIKLIADCTEWYGKTNIIKDIDTNMRMKNIQKNIDGVIAISRYLYEYYKDYTKVALIPPLTDIEDKQWEPKEKINDVLTFSYVGSPGRDKDKLDMLIKALSEIKTERKYLFNIIGLSKEQFLKSYPEYQEIVKSLEEKVSFKGRVKKSEALAYLKNSDFSVFFRLNNLVAKAGFPTKYAEATTCAVPVITNKTSDLGEYLKDSVNGFVIDGYEVDDVKETLEKVLSIPNEDVASIKQYCMENRDVFHYGNYQKEMKKVF